MEFGYYKSHIFKATSVNVKMTKICWLKNVKNAPSWQFTTFTNQTRLLGIFFRLSLLWTVGMVQKNFWSMTFAKV